MSRQRSLLPPTRLLIAHQVISIIEAEARKHAAGYTVGHETGGVLVGRRLGGDNANTVLIVGATGPGPNALTLPTQFELDVEYINRELARWHEQFPRLDYIGTWHKHPPNYSSFSPGDVRTAHEAFADPSYKMDELINPIVLVEGDHVDIFLFYMSRNMAEAKQPFIPLDWSSVTVVEDHALLIDQERRNSIQVNPESTIAPPWLREEHRQLKSADYEISIYRDPDHQQHFYFTLRHPELPKTIIYIETPSNYPGEGLSCYIEHNGQGITPRPEWLISYQPGVLRGLADQIKLDLGAAL